MNALPYGMKTLRRSTSYDMDGNYEPPVIETVVPQPFNFRNE